MKTPRELVILSTISLVHIRRYSFITILHRKKMDITSGASVNAAASAAAAAAML